MVSEINLFNADCLEIMENVIPDNSIDLILCDLPYGTTQNKWDSIIPLTRLWKSYAAVSKPETAVVLTTAQPFTTTVISSNLADFKYEWIWKKDNATNFLNAKKQPLRIHETVCVFYKEQSIYIPQKTLGKPYKTTGNGPTTNYGEQVSTAIINETGERYPLTILEIKRDKEKIHPTQKPVALMEYLIKTYTTEGMTVLDNCMGSGTTGVACKRLNRNFIGIEKDPEYFKIAQERINNV